MSKSNSEFWERYKHPLWQKRRLEVMQRAGFKCQSCLAKDETLNVHHTYYERDCDPWDYPITSLRCLCESCHKDEQAVMRETQRCIGLLSNLDRAMLPSLLRVLRSRDMGDAGDDIAPWDRDAAMIVFGMTYDDYNFLVGDRDLKFIPVSEFRAAHEELMSRTPLRELMSQPSDHEWMTAASSG